MKRILAAVIILAAGCTTAAPPPAPAQPRATPLAGAPCDPPLVVPASIIARVRAQFDDSAAAPPAPTAADLAAYNEMQALQRAKDWANLCYYRADNAALDTLGVFPGRVVFMGDSITQSWSLADPDFFATGYVNRGISGQTTPQMLLRFRADVLDLKPAAVHILAGVNDIAGNTGPTMLKDIQNNIISMVQLAQARSVNVILATPLPADNFKWAPHLRPSREIDALAAWVVRYAAENNLVLADYYAAMATPDGGLKPELTLDGVHPNKAGYAVMKPITQAAIAAALAG